MPKSIFDNPYYTKQLTEAPAASYASAGQGLVQLGTDIASEYQDAKNIQTQTPGLQVMDEFGTPQYNLGQQSIYVDSLNPEKAGKGMALKSAAKGAAAGAALGPLGAIAGGFIGGIAGAVGQIATRRKAKKQARIAESNLLAAQQGFNQQNIDATRSRLAREQYEDMLNPYNIPMSYY